jgi:hypothetical protein
MKQGPNGSPDHTPGTNGVKCVESFKDGAHLLAAR